MLTLRQLRYFDALARYEHFGRAARECAITQPALSMQIQMMEASLGVPLIERRTSSVGVTVEGREIAQRVHAILAAVRDLEDFAKIGQEGLAGELVIGVIPSVAPYLLPTLLPALAARYPALRLRVRETITHTLVDELAGGRLDAIVAALPIEHADFDAVALFKDRFLLAYPTAEANAFGERVDARDVPTDRLLLLEEGHCLRDQAMRFCAPDFGGQEAVYGTSSLSTIVQMVANGLGLTLLPEISLPVELRNGRVELARFVEPEPSRTIGLAWRSTSPRKRQFADLGRFIADWHADASTASDVIRQSSEVESSVL